ncbi:MAG: hypothetical protein K1Y02_05870 [Candidatus Hydrogenedentes bacterium]|nr:hypothetical protein [Candidatus Hydrogenedentota bacterium]
MIVCGIIAMAIAIAMPRLSVALAFGQLDSAARHVAGYGRSVTAYTALEQESATVVVDLQTQQYFTLRWLEETNKLFDDSGQENAEQALPADPTVEDLLALATENGDAMSDYALQVKAQFDRSFMRSLEARARTVNRNSILSDVGPLFDKEFKLDEDEEDDREEVVTSLLQRTVLPNDVVIESVRVGTVDYTQGQVEIEVTPAGLNEFVVFTLRDASGEYVTVTWDPITGNSHLRRGKEQPV